MIRRIAIYLYAALALAALVAVCGRFVPADAATANQGCRYVGGWGIECENSTTPNQAIPSGTATPLTWYVQAPPPVVANEVCAQSVHVHMSLTGGAACEAGQCDCDIRQYYPGTLRSGSYVRGDGVAAAQPEDSFCGFEAGITLGLNGSNIPTITASCPGCTAYGTDSLSYLLPLTDAGGGDSGTDSGTDSGSDSGTDSGADSGGGATSIAKVTPNDCSAGGGCSHALTFTGRSAAPTSCTINGVAMTSLSCSSANACTATSPAYGGSGATTNGSGSTLLTVSCTDGTTVSAGSAHIAEFSYLSSASASPNWHLRADTGITLSGSNVTTWADLTSTAANATIISPCTTGPTVTALWNSTGMPTVAFPGVADNCLKATGSIGTTYTSFIVGQFLSTSGNEVALVEGNQYFHSQGSFSYTTLTATASDTNAHVFVLYVTGGAGSFIQVDTTAGATGSMAGAVTSEFIGTYSDGTLPANFQASEIINYGTTLTSTEISNNELALHAAWGF